MTEGRDWRQLQDESHGGHHEYRSPHLRAGQPREFIVGRLGDLIREHAAEAPCTVLDMGAGHGSYTAEVLDAGATRVICTEMSQGAAERLQERFRSDDRVEVIYDPTGELVFEQSHIDVVCMISLLHHIPDYGATLKRLAALVSPGGSLVTFQDPDFYPRRNWLVKVVSKGTYLAWRLTQGGYREGLKSVARRNVGTLDETNPRDMVEYHVVRKGVDELAVAATLQPVFGHVEIVRYWSDHGRLMQRVVGRTRLVNTFGMVARDRHDAGGP